MSTGFEKLECWKVCNSLKRYLRENVLPALPNTEKYELYSQILRASRSATANIAEGHGRYHFKDNIKFLTYARGSVLEILDHVLEAENWNYITIDTVEEIRGQINQSSQLINGYIRYLRTKTEN